MSSFGDWTLPTGRKIQGPSQPAGYLGSISTLEPADEGRLELARRHLREIPADQLVRDGKGWFDTKTSTSYELVRSHVDLVDPTAAGATAFVVADGLIVPLRKSGTADKADKAEVRHVGSMGAVRVGRRRA